MKELIIRWEINEKAPGQITYFVNDQVAGYGDAGFDEIIKMLEKNSKIEKVVLKPGSGGSLGGESFGKTLPFGARYNEFKKVIGKRVLLIECL